LAAPQAHRAAAAGAAPLTRLALVEWGSARVRIDFFSF